MNKGLFSSFVLGLLLVATHVQAADFVQVKGAIYLDGSHATPSTANDAVFNITVTWDSTNIGSGSLPIEVGSEGFNSDTAYEVYSSPLAAGASFSVVENLPTTCGEGDIYKLAGYSVGSNFADAESQTITDSLNVTNLSSDQFVIVWNETCPTVTINPPSTPDPDTDGGLQIVDPMPQIIESISGSLSSSPSSHSGGHHHSLGEVLGISTVGDEVGDTITNIKSQIVDLIQQLIAILRAELGM